MTKATDMIKYYCKKATATAKYGHQQWVNQKLFISYDVLSSVGMAGIANTEVIGIKINRKASTIELETGIDGGCITQADIYKVLDDHQDFTVLVNLPGEQCNIKLDGYRVLVGQRYIRC